MWGSDTGGTQRGLATLRWQHVWDLRQLMSKLMCWSQDVWRAPGDIEAQSCGLVQAPSPPPNSKKGSQSPLPWPLNTHIRPRVFITEVPPGLACWNISVLSCPTFSLDGEGLKGPGREQNHEMEGAWVPEWLCGAALPSATDLPWIYDMNKKDFTCVQCLRFGGCLLQHLSYPDWYTHHSQMQSWASFSICSH